MARRKKTLVGLAFLGAAGVAGYACDRRVKKVVDMLLAAVVDQIRRLQPIYVRPHRATSDVLALALKMRVLTGNSAWLVTVPT